MHEMLYQYQNRMQKCRQKQLHNLDQNQNENLVEHLDMIYVNFPVQLEINTNKPLPRQLHGLNL